jgi:hypothetical protein
LCVVRPRLWSQPDLLLGLGERRKSSLSEAPSNLFQRRAVAYTVNKPHTDMQAASVFSPKSY